MMSDDPLWTTTTCQTTGEDLMEKPAGRIDLSGTLHRFASPMLDLLGDEPKEKYVRHALEVAIAVWNSVTIDDHWDLGDGHVDAMENVVLERDPHLSDLLAKLIDRKRDDFDEHHWAVSSFELLREQNGGWRLKVEARLRPPPRED